MVISVRPLQRSQKPITRLMGDFDKTRNSNFEDGRYDINGGLSISCLYVVAFEYSISPKYLSFKRVVSSSSSSSLGKFVVTNVNVGYSVNSGNSSRVIIHGYGEYLGRDDF